MFVSQIQKVNCSAVMQMLKLFFFYLQLEQAKLQFDFSEREKEKTWVFPQTAQNGKCTKNEKGPTSNHVVL